MTSHDDHPPFLGHHWENPRQQFEAGKLGMWLFLATEILFFGGLFCAYAVWRGNHPEIFKYGSQFLDTKMGAINTAVLIASSLTMAWGVTCAQQNRQFGLKVCLWLTLAGACGFLVIKYFEYSHKFHEGWYPGLKFYDQPGESSHTWQAGLGAGGDQFEVTLVEASFQAPPVDAGGPIAEPSTVMQAPEGPGGLITGAALDYEAARGDASGHGDDADHAEDSDHGEGEDHVAHPLQDPLRPAVTHMFFNIYFMMTGLHGIHVVIGIVMISWLLVNTYKGKYSNEYFTQVDLGGLYWHIVDLIWIFLFPLFYLI